jgi:thiamine-phosphate pyrophosphorylase
MTAPPRPQLYLIAPAGLQPDFADRLGAVMDAHPTACLRLQAGPDAAAIRADTAAIRPVCAARGLPILLEAHFRLAAELRLDGVHLPDGPRHVRAARAALGPEASIGVFCGASRHLGMVAGEAGADYIAFGPVGATELGSGDIARPDLFAWWAELIELPVIAEGGLTADAATNLAPHADFLAIGPEIWRHDDPVAALAALWPASPGATS